MEKIKDKKNHHVFAFSHLKDTTPITKERAKAFLEMSLAIKKHLKETQGIEMQ